MTENANGDKDEGKSTKAATGNGKHDVITHRIVVISLGLTVLMAIGCMTLLESLGHEPAPALANVGSVAIGALAMTLASIMRPH